MRSIAVAIVLVGLIFSHIVEVKLDMYSSPALRAFDSFIVFIVFVWFVGIVSGDNP